MKKLYILFFYILLSGCSLSLYSQNLNLLLVSNDTIEYDIKDPVINLRIVNQQETEIYFPIGYIIEQNGFQFVINDSIYNNETKKQINDLFYKITPFHVQYSPKCNSARRLDPCWCFENDSTTYISVSSNDTVDIKLKLNEYAIFLYKCFMKKINILKITIHLNVYMNKNSKCTRIWFGDLTSQEITIVLKP